MTVEGPFYHRDDDRGASMNRWEVGKSTIDRIGRSHQTKIRSGMIDRSKANSPIQLSAKRAKKKKAEEGKFPSGP